MVDTTPALQRACPSTEVYAVVGWQGTAEFAELAALRAANHLGSIVIIEAGTNGAINPHTLEAVLTSLADRAKVVVINNHVDRPWAAVNNAMFPQVLKNHPNAVLLDWDAVAKAHPEWLSKDGIHLEPAGDAPYAGLIKAAGGC